MIKYAARKSHIHHTDNLVVRHDIPIGHTGLPAGRLQEGQGRDARRDQKTSDHRRCPDELLGAI